MRRAIYAALAALLLCGHASVAKANLIGVEETALALQDVQDLPAAALERFLDHLMRAESNGRDEAANPRSTALGAFQFIKSTFVSVARRHFAAEVGELSDGDLLALRTKRHFARRVAAAYSRENAAYLQDLGVRANYGHLRLAFLLGAGGAVKVARAAPQTPVSAILSAAAVRANPFMKSMTAADLMAKAQRDVGFRVTGPAPGVEVGRGGPPSRRCKQGLASCRHWIATRATARQHKAGFTAAAGKALAKRV